MLGIIAAVAGVVLIVVRSRLPQPPETKNEAKNKETAT